MQGTVSITLDDPAAADTILSVVLPDKKVISSDDNSAGVGESVALTNPGGGTYDAVACAFAGGAQNYHGKLVLHTAAPNDLATPGGTAPGVMPPTYANHVAPGSMAKDAGEPSIGVNWKTGAAFLQAGLETDKILFDGAGRPTWSDVSSPTTSVTSLDPILASDDAHGRVFVSQLTAMDSLSAFTDDDGGTYSPSQGGGIPSGVDHQTLGSGPYPAGSMPGALTAFPNAVYYCSQDLVTAFCARSDTGGISFGAGVPLYTSECGGLHGHVRVSPDGTVYVPNKACNGKQGVAVSTDAGLSFTVKTVPLSTPGDSDPSIAAGKDNTAYYGFTKGDGKAEIAVTRDHGRTFSKPVDVGAALSIQNAAFPEVIAGDGDRAAFAFLGTKTAGAAQDSDFGKNAAKTAYTGGAYHLYIATTYDRGGHWSTVDATGNDPVQRGKICQGGTVACGPRDRNLLDFMDIQVDKQGRALVGWADGCTAGCVTSNQVSANTFSSKGVVSRQTSGKTLFAPVAAVVPPVVAGTPSQQPTAGAPGGGSGSGSGAASGSGSGSGAGSAGAGSAGGAANPVSAGPSLPRTGLPLVVPVLGLALLLSAASIRRRRTT